MPSHANSTESTFRDIVSNEDKTLVLYIYVF